jgi:hypothetical protein
MANNITANFAKYYAKEMQMYFEKKAVHRPFVNWEAQKALKDGDTFNKPYGEALVAVAYSRTAAFTAQDIASTNETLTVDKQFVVPFYIDNFDEIQDSFNARQYYTKRSAEALVRQMDGDVLAEVANATYDIDYYDIDSSKTIGDGCDLNTTTLPKIFAAANKKLDRADVPEDERAFVGDPDFYQVLLEYLAGRETALGDRVGINGYKGKFYGVEIYISNACYWTGKVGIATNPTDGDTISINGVTFTFVDTLGSTAGNVHITSEAAKTVDSLVAAINAPDTSVSSGTDAGFVALSDADQKKLNNITATDGGTYITLVSKGHGYVPVAETFDNGTDAWDDGLNMIHYLFARKGVIHMVVQSQPKIQVKEISDRLGVNIVASTLYGIKTFKEGKDQMVDVKVNTLNR